jgi:uncharacterized protein YkwD
MNKRWPLAMFGMVVLGAAVAQPSSGEAVLLRAVNRERQSMGLSALRWDEALATAAQQHANSMAKQGAVSHMLPGEPSLPGRATRAGAHFTSLSENVVEADDVQAAHTAFMHSPSHRANILDDEMNSVGIGVAERGGQVYVVEDFSKAKE